MKNRIMRLLSLLFCLSLLFSTCSLQTVKAESNSPATSSASFTLSASSQGSFTSPGSSTTFTLDITNTGTSSDTFDLKPTTTWAAAFYQSNGTTPLTDTNSNTFVDTGALAASQKMTLVIKVQTPAGAVVGDNNQLALNVVSSNDTDIWHSLTLQTAIPASFAQAYTDSDQQTMNLALAQSSGVAEKTVTGLDPSASLDSSDPILTHTPNGNLVYLWNKQNCMDPSCSYGDEIYFSLLTPYGDNVVPPDYLLRNEDVYPKSIDYEPDVAVTPDGHIGVLWVHEITEFINNQWKSNFNLYLFIIDQNGNRILNPTNITNSNLWGDSDTDPTDLLIYTNPRITATNDNHFVYAINERAFPSQCSGIPNCYLNDIYYSVLSDNGTQIKNLTRLTSDSPTGTDKFGQSSIITLNGNQAFLSMIRTSDNGLFYAVINSDGVVQKDITLIPTSDLDNTYPTAAQFSDGNILLTWSTNSGGLYYDIMTSGFVPTKPTTALSNPFGFIYCGNSSVSADSAKRAIITWQCDSRSILYALIQSDGAFITPPMPFISSTDNLFTNNDGRENTISSITPSTGVDTLLLPVQPNTNILPGQIANIQWVQYANHGQSTATHVVLTATLPVGLTYADDSSGITPTIVGNQVTWDLPDMDFLSNGIFNFFVNIPADAAPGTHYTVTFTLTAQDESHPADNTLQVDITVLCQTFLPLLQR